MGAKGSHFYVRITCIMLILGKLKLSQATLLLFINTLIPTNIVKTDCRKLVINNPTKSFNKIDK